MEALALRRVGGSGESDGQRCRSAIILGTAVIHVKGSDANTPARPGGGGPEHGHGSGRGASRHDRVRGVADERVLRRPDPLHLGLDDPPVVGPFNSPSTSEIRVYTAPLLPRQAIFRTSSSLARWSSVYVAGSTAMYDC